MPQIERPASAGGQVLVIVALGMVAMVAMVGLVIDAGHGWGQQRDAQNGADAAAHAGAIVVLEHLAAGGKSDLDVHVAVQLSASQNGIGVPEAWYTDWRGDRLPEQVGPADGLNPIPSDAQGVEVVGRKTFQTFFARILGFGQFTANTSATAVAGSITNPCDLEEGCILMPIAFPATMITCSSNGQAAVPVLDASGHPQPWPDNTQVVMPLCGGNPGSVGWIDWTPPFGGTSEIVGYVENPPPQEINLPSWQYITETGNLNALPLENALNEYAGQIVLLPLFDGTCNAQPSNPELDGCPPANTGGSGVNQWYHLPSFAAFRLDYPKGAYINGTNTVPCDTGNGATSCIVGTFVRYVGGGAVGEWDPEAAMAGVQLVR